MENIGYYKGLLTKVDSLLREVEDKGHDENKGRYKKVV